MGRKQLSALQQHNGFDLQLNPEDVEIEDCLGAMQDDLSMCLTVMHDAQARN
jgi:hypothetical protein